MLDTAALYQEAQDNSIPVILLDIPESGSMCLQTEERRCYIGLDNHVLDNEASRRVHLAHELGHCSTGSFYNRWAAQDIRQKHENRADKWAIQRLVPEEELRTATADGYTDVWTLAELFGVTPTFMRKAICWYTHGNLAIELY